jgi:hypothetical protein
MKLTHKFFQIAAMDGRTQTRRISYNGRRVHDVLRNQARGLSGVRCREPVDIRSSSAASTEYIDGCNPPPDIQDTSIASILYIVLVSTTPMSLQAKSKPRNAFLGKDEPARLANGMCRASLQ